MKKLTLLALIAPSFASAFGFDDIPYWIGTGTKRAALVIDWKSGPGPQSLVWGYRFDGDKTGQDMFNAVRAADPRLSYGLVPGVGYTAVERISFDRNGSGIGPGDSDQQGWFTNGFWGYYAESAPTTNLPAWGFANEGFSTRLLSDGSWDGWAWAQDFIGTFPSQPTPVPEPMTATVLGIALISMKKFRKK